MAKLMLNIGCGKRLLPGFVNIDIIKLADLRHDVTKGIPYKDHSVDYIFSEHFLEHISQRQGLIFLRECRRVLKPGGVVRISMPDLDSLVGRYANKEWRSDGDMFRLGFEWVDNRCEMLNIAMREWGHRWVYNEEELKRVGELSGLEVRGRMAWGESDISDLKGLEYREGSKLIMEFSKKNPTPLDSTPKVSILIPAYNPTYFEAALSSALSQDYSNLEVIVCDDSETKEINSIVEKYLIKDSRISYFKNKENKGPLFNYVECLNRASGEYIQFLNDDDLLGTGNIAKGSEILSKQPDVSLVVFGREYINDKGVKINQRINFGSLIGHSSILEGSTSIRYLLSMGVNYIGEPTSCMFRRENVTFLRPHAFTLAGAVVRGLGDLVLWCNLLSQGDMAYLSTDTCYIRIHDEQWRNNSMLNTISANNWLKIRKHAYRLGLYEGVLGSRGLPDPFVYLKGIKYKSMDEDAWRISMPKPFHFAVFFWRAIREFWSQYKRIATRRRTTET